MRVHVFQHVFFEDIGNIKKWLEKRGCTSLTYTKFFKGELPPDNLDFDLLIVMGGPMGVYDKLQYPWLSKEIEFVAHSLKAGKKVLGICLGAQIIAASLEAKVYPNKFKEIGWWPVELLPSRLFSNFPQEIKVFQWHGDTFDLPEGATLLATNKVCSNQAFLFSNNGLALQFHLEVGAQEVENLVNNCAQDLVSKGPYVQNRKVLLEESWKNSEPINNYLFSLLDNFLSL